MKSDLQKAALQKLAGLSKNGYLSQERQDNIRYLILKKCPGAKDKEAVNGVNGITSTPKLLTRTELHSLLALEEFRIDDETVDKLFDIVSRNFVKSSRYHFALACSVNNFEAPPSRRLGYSLAKALFQIPEVVPRFLSEAQLILLEYLHNVSMGLRDSIEQHDLKGLLLGIMSLVGTTEATIATLSAATPEFVLRLVDSIQPLLDSQLLIKIESVISSSNTNDSAKKVSSALRNPSPDTELNYLLRIHRRYILNNEPLGAFIIQRQLLRLLETVCYLACPSDGVDPGFLPLKGFRARFSLLGPQTLNAIAHLSQTQLESVESSADFLKFNTSPHQELSLDLKATSIRLACVAYVAGKEESHSFIAVLESVLGDSAQMSHDQLSSACLDAIAAISMSGHEHNSELTRQLRDFIVNFQALDYHNGTTSSRVCFAAKRLAWCLSAVSPDRVVSTLYSLVNVLAPLPPPTADRSVISLRPRTALTNLDQNTVSSSISLTLKTDDQRQQIYSNVIEAISEMVVELADEKVAELMISLLGQKFGRVNNGVDKSLVWGLAKISSIVKEKDFRQILKLHAKARADPTTASPGITETIMEAHQYMARRMEEVSPYREILLTEILNALIEVWATENIPVTTPSPLLPKYFQTVATVLPVPRFEGLPTYAEETVTAFRNMWFACVIHGVHPNSKWVQMNATVLRKVAANSPLLTLENMTNDFDADLELNPVLNRIIEGKHHPNHRALEEELIKLFPSHQSEIKAFDYSKLVFIGAVTLVETLRSEHGKCSLVLDYFDDANLEKSDASQTLKTVVDHALKCFVEVLRVNCFEPGFVAFGQRELRELLIRCCDPVPTVQTLAQRCCDKLISTFPALLCSETTTYVLLELLTLLWEGCLSQETDLYSPKFQFRSALTGVEIELRDSSEQRRRLLDSYHHNARKWLVVVLQKSPDDIRMVLQSYLAEMEESSQFLQNAPGRQLALEIGRTMPAHDSQSVPLRNIGGLHVDHSSKFISELAKRQRWRYAKNIIEGTSALTDTGNREQDTFIRSKAKRNLLDRLIDIENRCLQDVRIPEKELQETFVWAGTHLYASIEDEFFLVRKLVSIPFRIFTSKAIDFGVSIWVWISRTRPSVHARLLAEIAKCWEWALKRRKGLFNASLNPVDPFSRAMEYKPTDMQRRAKQENYAREVFTPHLLILRYLRQHFQPCGPFDSHTTLLLFRVVITGLTATKEASTHPLAREARLQLLLLGLDLVREGRLPSKMQSALQLATYKFALAWYAGPPIVQFGSNRIQLITDYQLLQGLSQALDHDPELDPETRDYKRMLMILLKDETFRVHVWLNPLTNDLSIGPPTLDDAGWMMTARAAWRMDPILAVHLVKRFAWPALSREIRRLVITNPQDVVDSPLAAQILLGEGTSPDLRLQLRYLLYWKPVVPPTAIAYFLETYGNNPLVLQYAMRSLLSHSIQITFFYVPQIVQALRYDRLGYVEQFIMEASLLSPLFAHQIIWNMKANAYKDEDSSVPDSLKPTLDKVMDRMIGALSGADKSFYEREFSFFNDVTSISGKLKPYIKKSKAEKKAKIDEEMKKIPLDVGVYLPSNPDGEVVGIDRKSGRPLQSHAKAPFMATFKVRRVKQFGNEEEAGMQNGTDEGDAVTEGMQSAIFKVGDDCRQDVLALQLISCFRNIFNGVGLDLYLFPYRVTATAPGCGVIDVLPNSISRDMLGREHVNGLYEYFMREHEGPNSTKFQMARNNFITSMAAYSIVTYLLQFKDRHNGNIMIDSDGHILHVDFGFCFDIAPGGITFETAPFKLTHEMITVISGPEASKQSQYYRRFEELCIKGFLACRPYAEQIIRCVLLMLDSGLPCFKGMTSIKNLRERFVLEKSEREASDFVLGLIKASHENIRTVMYDQYQYATNGIPY